MRTLSHLQPLLLGLPSNHKRSVSWWPLIFGLLIGIFLGRILYFEHETELDTAIQAEIKTKYSHKDPDHTADVYLRCIVMVQAATDKPHKFVASVRDTYSKRCNETLYFTSIKKLEQRFSSELEIFHLDGNVDPRQYPLYHDILAYIHSKRKPASDNVWNIILNEQNYLITSNVRHFLSRLSTEDEIIVGRVTDIRSIFDYIFPLSSTVMFNIDAGIILSSAALKKIVLETHDCGPYKWGMPLYTGKALLQCAKTMGFQIWDPIDEEKKRTVIGKSPRNTFAVGKYAIFGRTYEEARKTSDCCSESAVLFGLVNYRDQRVLEYALEKVRVFGL
uniref:Hexosyltransferase n=1 Tax=Panagrellus redivivus TaxID=6233 RepID=A0A7E4V1Y5_PANRE